MTWTCDFCGLPVPARDPGIRLVPADPFDLIRCSRCVAIADAGRWQLPAGLSEDELLRGYVPFQEEPR